MEIMQTAYDEMSAKAPFLPFPDSVLPALLALRKTHQTVEDTKAYLSSHLESVSRADKRLEAETSNLRDQQALSECLQGRARSLRHGLHHRMDMGPDDIARDRIAELKQKKKHYDVETSKLLKSLRRFIDGRLSSLLAAEDLGGPVVGDLMDIDDDSLAAGFSSHGKLKKAKANPDQDKRQRRIDDIWGAKTEAHDAPTGESAAAGADLRDLTEELLNTLVEADGDSSAAYVQLRKESAATRFLVRCQVAQFHPRDASRLRMVDFGRELDE